jgi:hypothetical protein
MTTLALLLIGIAVCYVGFELKLIREDLEDYMNEDEI